MRILHMIPDIGISNGVMSVILNYAKAMPNDVIFDIIYFANKEKSRKGDIEALGGNVYKVNPPSVKELLSGKMDSFFKAHKGEWEALHIHCPHYAVFIAPYAKKNGLKKIFVHCHTTEFSLKGNSNRNRILSLYAKYFIKNKIACSEDSGKLWYGKMKFTVLNNAIDCDAFRYNPQISAEVRNNLKLNDCFIVGHIGNTGIPQKNHTFIFKVFAQIKKERDNAVLLLIGAEKTNELDSLAKSLNIAESVCYLGVRSDVDRLLQGVDVFLFPSISEGLPVSVVEAQACGLPVLMSDSVTDDVIATDLVHCKSLNDNAKMWAEKCVALSYEKRKDTFEIMKNSGWDIFSNADVLVNYYKGKE